MKIKLMSFTDNLTEVNKFNIKKFNCEIDDVVNNVYCCELNLKDILPATEYMYGSEVFKAKEVMSEYRWWTKHQNKTFVLNRQKCYFAGKSLTYLGKGNRQMRNKIDADILNLRNKTRYGDTKALAQRLLNTEHIVKKE
jgi:hypothetical protein